MTRLPVAPGCRILWLVEVEFAAGVVRMSTEDVDVDGADGAIYRFHGVLPELDVTEALSQVGGVQDAPSLSFAAVWPVDVPALVAAGHALAWCRATVSRWVEGSTYEARRRIIVGRVNNPEYGAWDEPTSCTIELPQWAGAGRVPATGAIVTGETWVDGILSLPIESLGKSYPEVFGNPGRVSTSIAATGRVAGSRARWGDLRSGDDGANQTNIRAVIAGQHVDVERVYVTTSDGGTALRLIVRNGFDDLGQPIAFLPWFYTSTPAGAAPESTWDGAYDPYTYGPFADFDAADSYALGAGSLPTGFNEPPPDIAPFDELFIVWHDDEDAARGGLPGDAGSVIEHLLQRSGLPVDYGRMSAAKQRLFRFRLDFAIDESCTAWDFIKSQLLPILPISLVAGPDGVYAVVWPYGDTPSGSVEHFDVDNDPTISRASLVTSDTSRIANEFVFKYAKNRRTDSFAGRRTIGAKTWSAAAPTTHPNARCIASQRRYRNWDGTAYVVQMALESGLVYADATSDAVCAWLADAYCFAERAVEYLVDEVRVAHVEIGHDVTVTDTEVGLTAAECFVESLRFDGSGVVLMRLQLTGETERARG